MKRGLEILGIGIVDIDSRDCMMLRAEQTPDKAYLEKQGEEYNLVDWYLDVFRKYKDKLLDITRYIVADAWFSKAKFVNEACLLGFHVISRLRDDAALWYSHDGVRTGKRGRPRIKGEKIDFKKLVLQLRASRHGRRKGLLCQGLFKGNETEHQSRGSLRRIRRTQNLFLHRS